MSEEMKIPDTILINKHLPDKKSYPKPYYVSEDIPDSQKIHYIKYILKSTSDKEISLAFARGVEQGKFDAERENH